MKGAEPGSSSRILLSSEWGTFDKNPELAQFQDSLLWEDLDPKEWLYRKIDKNIWMAIETWLISRKLTEVSGSWNEQLSRDQDGEYFCRVLSNSSIVKFVKGSQCICRRESFGISNDFNLNEHKLESLVTVLYVYIRTMRKMKDNRRTRDACFKLINRYAIYCYPDRPDLFKKLQALSFDLGYELARPSLRSKYQLIQSLLGWKAAKKAQQTLPAFRAIVTKKWKDFRNINKTGENN